MQDSKNTTTDYKVHGRLRREREQRICPKRFADYAERHDLSIMGRPKRGAQAEYRYERR